MHNGILFWLHSGKTYCLEIEQNPTFYEGTLCFPYTQERSWGLGFGRFSEIGSVKLVTSDWTFLGENRKKKVQALQYHLQAFVNSWSFSLFLSMSPPVIKVAWPIYSAKYSFPWGAGNLPAIPQGLCYLGYCEDWKHVSTIDLITVRQELLSARIMKSIYLSWFWHLSLFSLPS